MAICLLPVYFGSELQGLKCGKNWGQLQGLCLTKLHFGSLYPLVRGKMLRVWQKHVSLYVVCFHVALQNVRECRDQWCLLWKLLFSLHLLDLCFERGCRFNLCVGPFFSLLNWQTAEVSLHLLVLCFESGCINSFAWSAFRLHVWTQRRVNPFL